MVSRAARGGADGSEPRSPHCCSVSWTRGRAPRPLRWGPGDSSRGVLAATRVASMLINPAEPHASPGKEEAGRADEIRVSRAQNKELQRSRWARALPLLLQGARECPQPQQQCGRRGMEQMGDAALRGSDGESHAGNGCSSAKGSAASLPRRIRWSKLEPCPCCPFAGAEEAAADGWLGRASA